MKVIGFRPTAVVASLRTVTSEHESKKTEPAPQEKQKAVKEKKAEKSQKPEKVKSALKRKTEVDEKPKKVQKIESQKGQKVLKSSMKKK